MSSCILDTVCYPILLAYWPQFHGTSIFVGFFPCFPFTGFHFFWAQHEDSFLVVVISVYLPDEERTKNENREWLLDRNRLPHQAEIHEAA